MHFCAVAAREYGRLSKPRNTSLNWFIPALVNSSVGSSPGTTGELATTWWPLDSKNFRNVERISAAFMRARDGGRPRVRGRVAGPVILGGAANQVVAGLESHRRFVGIEADAGRILAVLHRIELALQHAAQHRDAAVAGGQV